MTADVRQQLTEALDKVERQARAASPGPWRLHRSGQDLRLLDDDTEDGDQGAEVAQWTYVVRPWVPSDWDECDTANAVHIARWDPAKVLRLVERDRQVLQRHQREPGGDCSHCGFFWPCPDLKDAASVWLGTPEVDRWQP